MDALRKSWEQSGKALVTSESHKGIGYTWGRKVTGQGLGEDSHPHCHHGVHDMEP